MRLSILTVLACVFSLQFKVQAAEASCTTGKAQAKRTALALARLNGVPSPIATVQAVQGEFLNYHATVTSQGGSITTDEFQVRLEDTAQCRIMEVLYLGGAE